MNKIGVYTSGGDAPGMNACLRAVVRTGIFNGLEVKGIKRGYEGMISNDIIDLDRQSVANIIQRGGTFLKTARSQTFMTKEGRKIAYDNIKKHGIDALVCVGGNGSYTGAKIFFEEYGVPCIGLPGTIDNDLFGTDFTIGYDTAINTALDAIDKIRDTAHSHERVFIVEVMGRNSGFIALDVAIAGGAEGALIPEDQGDWDKVLNHFNNPKRRKKSFSIIVVAEGDEQGGALILEKKLTSMYPDLKIRSTILGHVQRGGSPSARDRILASRLGSEAITALLTGQKSVTVGIVSDEVVYTPFEQAIKGKKSVSESLINLAEILSI
ncbi:MAG: 6-phosphofructokinase [Bacteroidia bacterium]|nr:6-phosphofructokinase [Bacteroidia bacterium]MDG2042166.1 6-phosphofructokinase [Bacteroidia bacterium]